MLSDTKSPAALHKAGRGGRGINTAATLGVLAAVDVNQCEVRAGINQVGWIHRSDHAQNHVQAADALGGLILGNGLWRVLTPPQRFVYRATN